MSGWKPIATAPQDRPIVVYAPGRDGLPEMASNCQWHPDAGFCIDELRQPTHWTEVPGPQSDKGRRWAAAQAWQAEHAVPDPQSDIERYRAQMAPLLAELGRLREEREAVAKYLDAHEIALPGGTTTWTLADRVLIACAAATDDEANCLAELANARGWLLWIEQTHPGLTAMWRRGDAAP